MSRVDVEAVQRACLDALEQGVVFTTLDGEILVYNDAAEELTGYTAEELTQLFRTGQWVSYRPDGSVMPSEDRPLRRTRETGEPVRGALVGWVSKGGNHLLLRLTTEPVRDEEGRLVGIVAAFLDVTAEHAAQQALDATNARYAALVERSTDIICVVDRNGNLTYASPAGEA